MIGRLFERPVVALCLGAGLYLTLACSPVTSLLEASMAGHMLVQLPLLALAGGLMVFGVGLSSAGALAGFNRGGVAGILVAVFAWSWWMIPRHLDAALADPWIEAAKFLSVPLLVGGPLVVGWRQAGPLVRGFFWAHAVSMLLALGWLYLQSPERLCVSYRIDQQALVGTMMLIAAVLLSAALTVRAFLGSAGDLSSAIGASVKVRRDHAPTGMDQDRPIPGSGKSLLLPFEPRNQQAGLLVTASGKLRRAVP